MRGALWPSENYETPTGARNKCQSIHAGSFSSFVWCDRNLPTLANLLVCLHESCIDKNLGDHNMKLIMQPFKFSHKLPEVTSSKPPDYIEVSNMEKFR